MRAGAQQTLPSSDLGEAGSLDIDGLDLAGLHAETVDAVARATSLKHDIGQREGQQEHAGADRENEEEHPDQLDKVSRVLAQGFLLPSVRSRRPAG